MDEEEGGEENPPVEEIEDEIYRVKDSVSLSPKRIRLSVILF